MNGSVNRMKMKKQTRKPTKLKSEVPLPSEPKPADWFGSMKGTIEILGDIITPANDEDDWDVLRD